MGDIGSDSKGKEMKLQKSYFDVLGICCSSEVPLVEKILQLEGIHKVTVVVPSRTVIVVHDPNLISQLQIVKALNQARLEASIRVYGTTSKIVKKWPSPYILACGVLLLASLFKRFFSPLQWLAVAAAIVGLPPIVFRSIAAVRRFTLDINILLVIAVAGSVALKDYLEAGFIVFLFTIAEWLESRASHKATAGMASLMSMAPQKAILAETGEVVDAQNVNIGAILAVKAGEVIPIDGIVVDGRSEVDESSLTGESFPVPKQVESVVWAGTLNLDGYISVRTTALAENSAVAKMARLVEEAQNSRSKTQRLIDSCAKYYTPAVVVIAAAIAVIPLILKVHNRKHWFQLALVLLVSACPCALVLSTPVATFCALLNAARIGLLVKGGDVLETLADTKVVALDKTGTITMGEFSVREFRPINHEVALDKLLYWVSSIESKSGHPMASALVNYARSHSIEPKPEDVSEFHIYPGEGIHGEIDGKNIYVGNKRIAARAKCETVPNVEDMKEAATVGYVFAGAKPVGIFTLSDTCRTGAAEAIRDLKSLGVKTAMLTGDSTAAAMHAQNQLGNAIEMVHAELLPEDKVRIISDLKTKEGTTVMVGDGLNDAPALAMANVGISMGISGSAVAMETSHITLMSNDIRKILKVIQLAKKTHRKIIVNMFFSMVTKLAILALAIAGHPLLWAAVLADVGTCLVVILNSMMLLPTRTTKEKKCCGSSHKSEGNCCGSSHKSHAHKPACGDNCAGGKCGSAGACKPNCSSDSHGHGCHDHGTEEEEKSHDSCSGAHKKENCHSACSKTSHCESSHKSQAHCSGSSCKSHTHSGGSSHQSHAHCSGSSHISHPHSGGSSHQSHAHCSDSLHKSHEHSAGSSHQSHGHCSGSSHKSHAHSGGSLHQSHGHCSGSSHKSDTHSGGSLHQSHSHCSSSSHKSHEHKHAHGDHCAKGTCGSAGASSQSNCARDLLANSCHETSEEGRSNHNCSCTHKKEEHHMDSPIRLHSDPQPVAHVTNACHEHFISITNRAEHNSDGLHDHSSRHIDCCNKEDVAKECSSNATCGHQPRKSAEKKEMGGCCKSKRKECGSKDGCKKEDCHTESLEHSHNNRDLILQALNASHEHMISMPSEAEHHEKHSVGHNSSCHKPETAKDCHSTEKKEMSGCCGSEREKREIDGCGKSYRKQCERQKSCCGGGMVQMPEIIIAD